MLALFACISYSACMLSIFIFYFLLLITTMIISLVEINRTYTRGFKEGSKEGFSRGYDVGYLRSSEDHGGDKICYA